MNQIIGVGTSFIGLAIAQVYFHKAALLSRSNPAGMLALFLRTSSICSAIAILPYLCLGLFGPRLFSVVFGPAWVEAGHYSQLLAMPYFFVFVVGPVFPVLTILQRQHWQLAIDGVGIVMLVVSISTVARLGLGAKAAIAAYGSILSLTYCGLYGAAGWAIWRNRRTFGNSLTGARESVDTQTTAERAVVS